jgi:hypothetical protein
MKRAAGGIGVALAVLTALTIGTVTAKAADPVGSEAYVVRPGDTLSGIAGRVLGDPQRWREILKDNPQIKNPNRIFPGDTLMLSVPSKGEGAGSGETGLQAREGAPVAAAAPAEQKAAPATEPASAEPKVEEPALPVEYVRAIPTLSTGKFQAAGWIADELPAIAIVTSVEDRAANGTGDSVIVNTSAESGTKYTVVRAERRVFHPKTKEYLGWLIRRLGTAEVTCPGERASTVVLKEMRDSASVGDYLIPYDETVLEDNTIQRKRSGECVAGGPEDAMIVALEEARAVVGEQDVVYIDRGTAACYLPGTRLIVYRELKPEGRQMIGELQVLRARERTATALITNSTRELQVADRLRVP